MIRFDKVSKVYESRGYHHLVLNNLNFTVERRTSLGICGANGSGKSTLMRLLAGVEYPTAGRVTRSMTTSWPLGYTSAFQSSLTGADNVRFISRIYGKDARAMADFVEEFAALGPFFRQPINTYSAGMVARLAFGLSLAIDFECYLIDEVTATGDERFRLKSEKALHDRRDKAALVMVSHVPETLRAYCDRGAVLFNGSLTFYDTIDEAIEMHLYFQHAASRDAAINMDPPNDKLSRRLRKSR